MTHLLCGCAGRGAGVLSAGDAAGFVAYGRDFEPRISRDEADARLAAWKAAVSA